MNTSPLKWHIELDPSFEQNGYILYLRESGCCWMVDPGLPPHAERMTAFVREHGLDLKAILLTHAHADHIAGVDDIRAALGQVPLYLAREEWAFLTDPNLNLSAAFGPMLRVKPDGVRDLSTDAELSLETLDWRVLDTSGHSPGGRSLYCPAAGVVFTGDALFAGGIGRTDFPYSDPARLLANIRDVLFTLPGETIVLAGHGPATTIETERQTNPYI
jgi:glyoxylase-like metal-dependent hydrolase (beta-lactamase superfamily II)